jgi:diguanylate cyclase (GGDEF)-like protein
LLITLIAIQYIIDFINRWRTQWITTNPIKANDVKKKVAAKHDPLESAHDKIKKIKEDIEQSASELNSVNKVLKHGHKDVVPLEIMKNAVTKNEHVEHKVRKAVDDLTQVNTELAKEVAKRGNVEYELADTKTRLAEVSDDFLKSQGKEEEARKLALQDPLTQLPNRVLFEQVLDQGLIQAKRRDWGLAVLFIDIDNFKRFNDQYGHDLGDKILLMVANRLQACVRKEDTVSRWGGDEFVCLLTEIRLDGDVARLAEKMVNRIAETWEFNGTVHSIITSIGIAIYPADGETAEILFKNADKAMYKAKRTKKRIGLLRESTFN